MWGSGLSLVVPGRTGPIMQSSSCHPRHRLAPEGWSSFDHSVFDYLVEESTQSSLSLEGHLSGPRSSQHEGPSQQRSVRLAAPGEPPIRPRAYISPTESSTWPVRLWSRACKKSSRYPRLSYPTTRVAYILVCWQLLKRSCSVAGHFSARNDLVILDIRPLVLFNYGHTGSSGLCFPDHIIW